MMPRVELIGDFGVERFILAAPRGRVRWAEETKSLDRLGGVFLTKALLSSCYSNVKLGHSSLPEDPHECRCRGETPSQNGPVFYSQIFELDPVSGLTLGVLQRCLHEGKQQWTIVGQLSRLRDAHTADDYVLFVEQEEYTGLSRSDETQKLFEFVMTERVDWLFLKTNQPYTMLESARALRNPKPTIMLTTLRALNGNSLDSHTWDAAVRHVVRELGNVPEWVRVGVELWNEGCVWVHGDQGFLVWDMEIPLGAQRLRGKGWTPGAMNATCACLLSLVEKPDWPTVAHVRDSWVLSRQCALLSDKNEESELLDLPERLNQILRQDPKARPRAAAFGVAAFELPIHDDWGFVKELKVGESLVQRAVAAGPRALRDQHCPFLKVGRLFEIEEMTIEQLLTLSHLLRDYASRWLAPRPLSIAVFGPAGSGKSFALSELVRSADLPLEPVFFSYNLSQLHSTSDLEPAFHAVQSAVLRGNLPVVFWDEFDTTVDGRTLGWLKCFLGPMQDGEFFVRGAAHPLGRSVLVFAGATAHTFADFRSRDDPDSKDAKLPDFVSRIKAWIDIPQLPSSSTPAGRLQRAMLIHALIRRHAPHVDIIDEDVITFLVSDTFMTPRALERAIEAAALSDTNRFTRARLLFTTGVKVLR
jgi:hypothetical protein